MPNTKNSILRLSIAVLKKELSQRAALILPLVPMTPLLLAMNRTDGLPSGFESGFPERLFRLFAGDPRQSQDMPYRAPILWIFLFCYITFATGGLPVGQSEDGVLLRSGSKRRWWAVKCLSGAALTFAAYSAVYLMAGICALLCDEVSFTEAGLTAALLPPTVTLCLCLGQAVINLWLKPAISYFAVSAVLILSTYLHTPLLIGSYSQLMRSSLVKQGGISPWLSLGVTAALDTLFIIAGAVIAGKSDFIRKKGW